MSSESNGEASGTQNVPARARSSPATGSVRFRCVQCGDLMPEGENATICDECESHNLYEQWENEGDEPGRDVDAKCHCELCHCSGPAKEGGICDCCLQGAHQG